jgi:hypothetical protein
MGKTVGVQGPIEEIDGQLVLLIPLEFGGRDLAANAAGIGEIVGDVLRVDIPDWLAQRLNLSVGTIVDIDNTDGKFNIRRVASESPSNHH